MSAGLPRRDMAIADKELWRKSGLAPGERDALVIGLVNNMPDAELQNTEKQFQDLLCAVSWSCGLPVHLRLLALPGVPRSDAGRAQIIERYEDVTRLADEQIDGLIVTGTEPRAPNLTEEPFWPAFIRLVDWAEEHTRSTIWSCLAAHAAVFYLDGIERYAFAEKLSGVFKCEKAVVHPFLSARPSGCFVPQSRYNGLVEDALVARGYRTLLRSPETGPATFGRQGRSLFVFVQGHPEYDRHALHREYRRDVGRFLRGRSDRYPNIPMNYFDHATTTVLEEFRAHALRNRSPELATQFPVIGDAAIPDIWSAAAVELYRKWLTYLHAERAQGGMHASLSRRGLSLAHIAGTA